MLAVAQRVGINPDDCVAGLIAGVPVLLSVGNQSALIAALTASNFPMASLSRNTHSLPRLLTRANVAQARVCRDMLEMLNKDIRGHLVLCSRALADCIHSVHSPDLGDEAPVVDGQRDRPRRRAATV